jgi:hypothetical protein
MGTSASAPHESRRLLPVRQNLQMNLGCLLSLVECALRTPFAEIAGKRGLSSHYVPLFLVFMHRNKIVNPFSVRRLVEKF